MTSAPVAERARREAPGGRSRRLGAWYVLEHELREIRSYGVVTIAEALGAPLIAWLAFGLGVGALVQAGTGSAGIDGVPYLAFVLPAMMCGLALQVWSQEAMFGTLIGITWRRTFVAMRATPLSVPQIATGFVLSVLVRTATAAIPYAVVVWIAGAFSSPWAPASVAAALLGAAAFGVPLMAYAATIRRDTGQPAMVFRFVVLPLTLFSGTMFPLSTLPDWLEWIGWASPLWHSSQLARAAAYGTTEPAWLVLVHLGVLVVLVAAGWWLFVLGLRRRLER
ncbi:MAG: hypothetical protein BGO95_07435 [Micrococcales bacterium 73-13]|nr:MAG: hypothetical protein BGO95_07435 [Micrococcales bacterium 73-13]